MNPEMWEKVTEIYHSALELEPDKREAFLDERCAKDKSLRAEVESLLSANEEAGSFIAEPVIKDVAPLLTVEKEQSLIGKQLGSYKILSRIGAGGMGEVYLAQDSRLDRSVAIKTLPSSLLNHQNYLRRFETEAKAISALNHPNILTIYEIGESDGNRFLATEYVTGETLRKRLDCGAMSLSEILEVAVQAASALSTAHEKGIIHRDIKPENIMIREDGLVKVLDFGLAKLIEKTAARDPKVKTIDDVNTAAGIILGTVSYMSPEQARGKTLDVRTDVWSLGVCLYEILTGHLPFDGETTSDRLAAIIKTEFDDEELSKEVPDELNRIISKCLSKVQEKRYQHAGELLIDLRAIRHELEFAAKQKNLATNQVQRFPTEEKTRRMSKVIEQKSEPNKAYTVKSLDARFYQIKSRRPVLAALTIALIAAAFCVYYFTIYPNLPVNDNNNIKSIAVMPFTNVSGNPDAEYLSDGISESLINSLSKLPELKVIARSSSFKYKNKDTDWHEAARELNVEAILSGRVLQRGENLQISVELINANDKRQIWGEQYYRRSSDLLAFQSEISREISRQMRIRLTTNEQTRIEKLETTNPEAYELVLKGRLFRSRGGLENRHKAIEYFQQAIIVDPNYALAHAELSEGYRSLLNNRIYNPKDLLAKAQAAAHRAVNLDEGLAEAHFALATVKRFNWEWQEAESEYKRAIDLNPNLASAYSGYASYLSLMNRHDEAIAEVKYARELDPLSLTINVNVAYTLYFAKRYDEAIEHIQNTIELDPKFPTAYSILASIYTGKGLYREAADAYQKTIKLGGSNSGVQIHLGVVLTKSGEKEKGWKILKQMETSKEYVSPVELATLYTALDKREQAFASLEKGYVQHDSQIQFLLVSASFDELRSDSRFQDLLRRVGLS